VRIESRSCGLDEKEEEREYALAKSRRLRLQWPFPRSEILVGGQSQGRIKNRERHASTGDSLAAISFRELRPSPCSVIRTGGVFPARTIPGKRKRS